MRLLSLILSLYFLTGSLMPGGHWDEFPGIINLMGHYQEHQQRAQNHSITFMEFLALHYNSDLGHKQQEDHSKLPFNHVCSSALQMAFQFLPQFSLHIRETSVEKIFSMPVFIPRKHIAELLQPPRF
jgi:hypothetical protein